MKDEGQQYDREFLGEIRRAMAFIAAVTGVISAACLSGLPSTTCYALADAYAVSLLTLSVIFALSIAIFYVLGLLDQWARDAPRRQRFRKLLYRIFGLIAILGTVYSVGALMVTAVNGAINIRAAVNHCFLWDEKVQQSNLHSRIPLYRDPFFGPSR